MKTQKIAAIDIGSNSIKLAVAEAAASNSFTITLQERERVRLGQETLRKRFLSPEAIERSAQAIGRLRQIADSRGADKILAVATASVREAQNAAEFVRAVEEKTGVCVEVLSSLEEARLIGIAAAHHFAAQKNNAILNVDIGGGSTELSLMRDGEPESLYSMKLGAVGLTERFLFSNPPKEKELKSLQNDIRTALERPTRELAGKRWQISSGTSGTILKLGGLTNFETAGAMKPVIRLDRLAALNEMLAKMPTEQRAQMPGVSPQRAEVIVAGGQILEGVMRALKIETLEPCPLALREGVLIDYLRKTETESLPPVPDVEDIKLRGVFAIGRRFGYEEKHALHVAFLAEKIFDALALNYDLDRHQRTLLAAAAILHDIGFHISHESHHKHSFYLIKHSEITGFTEAERNVIAHVARYHRRSMPKERHAEFMELNERDRRTVWRLGGILRLSEALDRSYRSCVRDLTFRRDKQDLVLEVFGDAACERELEAAELKKDMFETAFECRLKIARGGATANA